MEQGWRTVVRALAFHQSQWPKFKPWHRRHMWVEFVVGSLPCSKRFFSGYSGFPFSSKTNATLPISNSFWNAWTRFNEFLLTPKVFVCKHITIYHRNYGLLLNLQLLQISHV